MNEAQRDVALFRYSLVRVMSSSAERGRGRNGIGPPRWPGLGFALSLLLIARPGFRATAGKGCRAFSSASRASSCWTAAPRR
jgi:hypothetical protein